MAESPEYMSVPEIAAILRISKMGVYRLVRSGALPSIRIERIYRVERRDFDKYLESIATCPVKM